MYSRYFMKDILNLQQEIYSQFVIQKNSPATVKINQKYFLKQQCRISFFTKLELDKIFYLITTQPHNYTTKLPPYGVT